MLSPLSSTGLDERLVADWAGVQLPDAWPDRLCWQRLTHPLRIASAVLRGRAGRVVLPENLPGSAALPKYLLQEFHNLPNGNYSKSVTRGYARAFDALMLGTMNSACGEVAERLRGATRALDIGSGAGRLARAMLRADIAQVFALEPSPYLLQLAAQASPDVVCVQGVIEASGLPNAHFDAAGACFVFHEIPPRYADAALDELHRILVPGARLVLVEPSPEQWSASRREMWRRYGWRGLYFSELARHAHEPFAGTWHSRDLVQWFSAGGFRLEEDRNSMPWRMLVATRV